MNKLTIPEERTTHRRLLSSNLTNDRLKAARYYLGHSQVDDRDDLRNALQKESVERIRDLLTQALRSLDQQSDELIEQDPIVDRDSLRIAAGMISSEIIHEVSPLTGQIDLQASREIKDYASSNTKKYVDSLKKLLTALAEMRNVTSTPNWEDVAIAALIREVIEGVSDGHNEEVDIYPQVDGHLTVRTDKRMIRVILTNVLRNAIEATLMMAPDLRRPIIVSCEVTDRGWWLSVLDEGVGISTPDVAFRFGTSSKEGHIGSGLATVKYAVETLGGDARLESTARMGAKFVAQWPIR